MFVFAGKILFLEQYVEPMKRSLFLFTILSCSFLFGCGGSTGGNSSAANSSNTANQANSAKIDPANMPEGLSAKPIDPSAANAEGISANPSPLPKGATPTPGIPSEEEIKRMTSGKIKPGATPTPGIPSEEERKRMMSRPAANADMVNTPRSDVPTMKSSNKTQTKP